MIQNVNCICPGTRDSHCSVWGVLGVGEESGGGRGGRTLFSMFLELNIKATRGKNGCTRSGATQSVLHI